MIQEQIDLIVKIYEDGNNWGMQYRNLPPQVFEFTGPFGKHKYRLNEVGITIARQAMLIRHLQ